VITSLNGRQGGLPQAEIVGPAKTVFDWSEDACEPGDYPDLPARAFRDAVGRVQLIASHSTVRRAVGPDLDHLQHLCPPVMRSDYRSDPAQFDYLEWISSLYSPDGRVVFALVHDEYHGAANPGSCPVEPSPAGLCWYNAITQAVSTDGGRSYSHARPPGLVASVPYRFVPGVEAYGAFSPSNIVYNRSNGFYYSLFRVEAHGAQERGACVMRTRDPADSRSWRAWNGDEFAVSFVNPYRFDGRPEDHVCRPVAYDQIQQMSQSVVYSTYYDKFLLVGVAAASSMRQSRPVWGFYFSLSDDLVHWGERRLIKEVELPWTFRCGDADPVLYPSLLDPASRARNFDTAGKRAYLFFTQFHYSSCEQGPNRDLVRAPIEFSR
jgi:hypothetical protein